MISLEVQNALSKVYTKDELERGLYKLVKHFYSLEKIEKPMLLELGLLPIYEMANKKHSHSKNEMLQISLSVFENSKIYTFFLSIFSDKFRNLIERLLWKESMTDIEVEAFIEEPIVVTNTVYDSRYSINKTLLPQYYFFNVQEKSAFVISGQSKYTFSIHLLIKNILFEYYPKPLNYYLNKVEEIPTTLTQFSAEREILDELPRIISYYANGNIKYLVNGNPVDASLSKLQKKIKPKEYYDAGDTGLLTLRSHLLAGLLWNITQKEIAQTTVEIIKTLFEKKYILRHSCVFILNHLKGWSRVNEYHEFNETVEKDLIVVFKELPLNEWVSIQNLIELLEARIVKYKPISEGTANQRLYYEDTSEGYKSKELIYKETYYKILQIPFLQGTVCLFAAFGLMEIAYDKIDTTHLHKTFESYYDGIQYFKLTNLGAYVIGLLASYEAENIDSKFKLTLSKDSLMILAEGNKKIIDLTLMNFCEKVGGKRYELNYNSFLKDCKKKEDIENKIALFKHTIKIPLPEYWENQLAQMLVNADTIKREKKVEVFIIPPNDKELHRLIASDFTLRQLVMKAEQFHLLIYADNMAKFRARMKLLGYLIE